MTLPLPFPSRFPWYTVLFEAPASDFMVTDLPAQLQRIGQAYLTMTPLRVKPTLAAEARRWYFSEEGQETLCAVFTQAWRQMASQAPHAMPAHDARHAMFKVPATALEYLQAEAVPDFERIGLLGALLHDHGRWAEERLYGQPGPGMLHARLSFVLACELLEKFEMPAVIREQILIAVLKHTSGAVPTDPMPHKLTVVADRDQLYGPEIILRLFHHTPKQDGGLRDIYKGPHSVMDSLTHLLSNRLPGPLFSMPQQVRWLQGVLLTFLLMAEAETASAARFCSGERSGKPVDYAVVGEGVMDWQTAWHHAQALAPRTGSRDALSRLIQAPETARNPQHNKTALARFERLTEAEQDRLGTALTWADQQRFHNDIRQREALFGIAREYVHDTFVSSFARKLSTLPLG